MWLLWSMSISLLACCLDSHAALAQSNTYRVALLELESDELHDGFADSLTEYLRAALRAHRGVKLDETRVSLAQLSLGLDCNTSDPNCLTKIAHELQVDGVVFGKITHEGGAPVVLLRRFELKSGVVDHTTVASFRSRETRKSGLDDEAARMVRELLGAEPAPRLELLPSAPENRPLASEPVALHDSGLSGRKIAGFALLGGAALSAGMSVLSFVQVERSERNESFQRYRLAVGTQGSSARDVCDEADAGRSYGLAASELNQVKNTCNTGIMFEALQFVFIGTAVVSGGLAAYFLASGSGNTERQRPSLGNRTFSLTPSLARRGFALGARLKF